MSEYNDKPENPQGFKPPVKWLLGRQLLMGLKWILLYSLFKGKLDPRDWMSGQEYPGITEFTEAKLATETPGEVSTTDVDKFWGPTEGEFWFDYLADSGDGQTATYTVAYLCGSDFHVAAEPKNLPEVDSRVHFGRGTAGYLDLPRGRVLVVGGDTAYHISDYSTLGERFMDPFRWAAQDLKITDGSKGEIESPRRPLFGLPGNHDYYDIVDGFNRQFRQTTSPENKPNRENRIPQLSIPGLKRCQSASYFALRFPFGWQVWGLDCEIGRLDLRQQEFFKSLKERFPPNKLIVATPEPTTVFGKLARLTADPEPGGTNNKNAQAFKDLELELPFLNDGTTLPPDKIRLDIAGDVHHYERYWGPESHHNPDREKKASWPPSSTNYASVVAGMGGAFLHPSQTYAQEVARQALFPSKDTSRRVFADELFNFWKLISGGYVWLIGLVAAIIIYAAGTQLRSTAVIFRYLLEHLPGFSAAQLGDVIKVDLSLGTGAGLGLSRFEILLRIGALLASLVAVVIAVFYSQWLFSLRIPEKQREWRNPRKNSDPAERRTINYHDFVPLAALIVLGLATLLFGGWFFAFHRYDLPPFGASLMVMVSILWAVVALAASRMYSAWLFKLAYKYTVTFYHYIPAGVLTVAAVGIVGAGIGIFGFYPSYDLAADLLFAGLVFGLIVGLPVLGGVVAGELARTPGKVGFVLLGAWHAILLFVVPFLLVVVGNWAAWTLALLSIFIFRFIGITLMKLNTRWWLVLAWLTFGVWMIYLPIGFNGPLIPLADGLIRTLLYFCAAGLTGMIITCVWLGWYFAVCLAFDGHNNEAGGAATIEQYKQFVRIRLTENSLTAFAIAVDEVSTKGEKLVPKLVDVFTLSR
jgi:hypothetical protein